MRTVTRKDARDTVTPTLHRAQETLTDTVLPTVRDAFSTARDKSIDLLDSDVAHEARRRGLAVVKAAKGEPMFVPRKRWRFGLGMITLGAGIGVGLAWVARRLTAPIESYAMPVPSGTDGGLATTATTRTGATAAEDIDLRSGAPTTI
jgi:hypothetical protein